MAGTQQTQPPTSTSKGRKKATLLARVRQQLEFYFGDANLNKDRFLQEKLKSSEDGFISLSTLLTFNKLRTLTTDEGVLREAIRGSDLLLLSTDGLNVKRAVPLQETGPVDEKTLYVENLPEHADIEWVRGKFSAFGPVQYVSLPRFKSLKIKGFAFVEFDGNAAVERAIQYFTTGTDSPADIYEKEAALPVVPTVTVLDFDEEDLSAKHGHKRKRDEILADDIPHTDSPANPEPSSSHSAASKKPTAKDTKPVHATFSPELLPLKVMPKVTWLVLREKYLQMQKASYRALKQKLKILTVGDDQNGGGDGMEAELESDDDDQEMAQPRGQQRSQPRSISPPPKPVLDFLAGVIIHLTLSKPVEDKKKAITETRAVAHVLFVDVTSDRDVFVRCDDAAAVVGVTEALLGKHTESSSRVLEGDEEKTYWEKILSDMEKRGGTQKGRRGKAKVIARAEQRNDQKTLQNTHIKFD